MDSLQNIAVGFSVVSSPTNLFYCFVGAFIGTLVGVLPGRGIKPEGGRADLLTSGFLLAFSVITFFSGKDIQVNPEYYRGEK